jgi:FkbM family methyltransferase
MSLVLSSARRLVRWVCGRVLPRVPYPVLRGPLRGTRFILGAAAGEGCGASVYVNMVEPGGTRAFLDVLTAGQIVFDIGANIGYYTLVASRQVGASGRVLAFEPFPRNISYLYRHVVLNAAGNVTVVPMACSDRTALMRFAAGANCATGRLVDAAAASPNSSVEYVASVTVDEIVRESGLVPDVLKIDVEGAEVQVLRGAHQTLSAKRPTILLSVHSEDLRSGCTAYLRELGYAQPVVCSEPGGEAELLFVADAGGADRARQRPA